MQPQLQVYDPFQEEVKRRMLAARAAGWNENDIAAFATNDIMQHQQAQANNVPAVPAAPKKKHSFLLDTVAPIVGGTLGAAGGFLAAGPAGAIAGGAAGSGGAKALANKLEGNPVGDQVLSNTAFGALGGAGKLFQMLRAGSGAAKVVQGATADNGAGLQVAERAFTKAFQVPAKLAPRLDPRGTAQELLQEYPGLVKGSLPQMQSVADAVTGSNGALAKLTRRAIGNIRGDIRVDEFMPEVRGALTQGSMIDQNMEKRILQSIFKMEKPGALPMTMNPLDAFDATRNLEQIGYKFMNASTKLSPSPLNEQIGHVYLTAANALKDGLEKAAGNQNILASLKNPQTLMDLSKIHPNLAQKFMNASTLADIRRIQKPFVNLSHMIGLTEDASQSAGTQLVAKTGLPVAGAIAGGPVGAVAGLLASPFIEGATEAIRAPIATKAATLLSKFSNRGAIKAAQGEASAGPDISPTFSRLFKKNILPQSVAHTTGGIVTGSGQQADPSTQVQAFDPFASMGGAPGGADLTALTGGSGGGAQVPMSDGSSLPLSSFSPDVINKMIQDDIATTGGKNIDTISQIVNMQKALTPASSAAKSPFGKPTAQQYALANAGVQALQQLEQQIGANPDLVGKSGIPGQHSPLLGGLIRRASGTGQYDAVANNVIDTLLRLRTGAQANKQEIEMYRTQLFPQAGDSADTVKQKIQSLYQAFTPFLTMGDQSQQQQFDPFSQMGYAQ